MKNNLFKFKITFEYHFFIRTEIVTRYAVDENEKNCMINFIENQGFKVLSVEEV